MWLPTRRLRFGSPYTMYLVEAQLPDDGHACDINVFPHHLVDPKQLRQPRSAAVTALRVAIEVEKPEQVEEKMYDVLKWLFMSGAMDVCRLQHAQIQANPVVYDNCEKDGESTMSIAATDAHMVLMKELLEVYEDDSNCNTITSYFTREVEALPWKFNTDENMTKIVKVAVRDKIGLSESVDTFYSIRVDH